MVLPSKMPSDKQVVDGFIRWEQGWTAILAAVRNDPDAMPGAEDALWRAHEIARVAAVQAQARRDAAKHGSDPEAIDG